MNGAKARWMLRNVITLTTLKTYQRETSNARSAYQRETKRVMRLKLVRPLVFFDLETTGLNIGKDRIVELSYHKIFPDGTAKGETYRINPEMPIPEASSAIHGIYDADVKNAPTFKEIAPKFVEVIMGCDLAGYNSNQFDVPMLAEELLRAGSTFDLRRCNLIDAFVIFQKNEPRNLTAAYRFYCDKSLENAHSADADTKATAEVLFAQLERYPNLPNTIEELAAYTTHTNSFDFANRIGKNDKGEAIFNFGKHKGREVKEVFRKEPSYYAWIMQGDFPEYTKQVVTRLYLKSKD